MSLPNYDSIALMSIVDALKPKWRALVHEYGLQQVLGCIDDGLGLEDADDALWMARSARQAAWLATNYVSKRSFERWG